MFQSYPDIEYDEKARRINRIMKVAAVPVFIGLIASCTVAVTALVDTHEVTVFNDTRDQRVICRGANAFAESDEELEPGLSVRISGDRTCAVFDRAGAYVSCIKVDEEAAKLIFVSRVNKNVSAEECYRR